MRRRDFLAAVGGAAMWSPPATAEQPRVPTVGFLYTASLPDRRRENELGFLQGLAEAGYGEGRNVAFESLEGQGRPRPAARARELVR